MTQVKRLPLLGKVTLLPTWAIALAVVGAIGLGAIGLRALRPPSRGFDLETLTVPVQSEPLTLRITASGTVQPIRNVNLSPKQAGILEELLVEQGDTVDRGQVIARMESDSLRAEVARAQARVAQAAAQLQELRAGNRPEEIAGAEAAVAQATARLAETRARLHLAEDRLERNRSLAEEGAISRDELDSFVSEVDIARALVDLNAAALREARESLALRQRGFRAEDIAVGAAQLAEAEAQLLTAEVQLDDSMVSAPFAGTITQRYATEGAFVTPTTSASDALSATSTAIVALAHGLEVLAEVPEVDIGQIAVGQPVEIRADAYPDKRFSGVVHLVAPEAVVEQNVTSFEVRVELLTGLEQLRSGMNVDATFVGDEVPDALVVPTVAIVTLDGQTGVLVPEARDRIRFEPIAIGSSVGGRTQVLDGIDEGQRIFIDLPPGQSLENLNFGRRNRE